MYGDELTMLLDVNSIIKTGMDQTGKFLPTNFSMGGSRPVGYGYFSAPFVAIFGMGAVSIRLLSVLAGVGCVLLIYYLGKLLFSRQIAVLAAALMAISPWDLSLSRGGFETHFALFLALLMIISFLIADRKPILYVLSAVCFGLSINTYSTYKLTLPIFIPLLNWFNNFKVDFSKIKNQPYLITAILILAVFLLFLPIQALINNSESRFLSQNIFADNDTRVHTIERINEERLLSPLNPYLSKILHNSIWEYSSTIVTNYLNNFSVSFLFFKGDKNPRHNMTGAGELYAVELISTAAGLWFLFRKKKIKMVIFLLSWLFLSPIPTSLLMDPHALRSSFMLPPLVLLSAIGLSFLWELRYNFFIKILIFIFFFGFLLQSIYIFENLYFISPIKYSRFWAEPAKKAAELAMENRDKYDSIFLVDRIDTIEFAYPVYANISPQQLLEQSRLQTKIGEYKFKKYGNVYIGAIPDSGLQRFLDTLSGSVLYIGPESDSNYLKTNLSVINGKDRVKALVITAIGKKIN